ncbi:hypothetical protein MRX96_051733 [Rhipicephalus microplus]
MERCWSVMQENGALSGLVAADSVEGLDTACSSEHLHNKCEGREGIPHVGTTVKPTHGDPMTYGDPMNQKAGNDCGISPHKLSNGEQRAFSGP